MPFVVSAVDVFQRRPLPSQAELNPPLRAVTPVQEDRPTFQDQAVPVVTPISVSRAEISEELQLFQTQRFEAEAALSSQIERVELPPDPRYAHSNRLQKVVVFGSMAIDVYV